MKVTDKLNHIKNKLREIVCAEKIINDALHTQTKFATLAADNWIKMIEDFEDTETGMGPSAREAYNSLIKTIARWEAVYGEIKEEAQ